MATALVSTSPKSAVFNPWDWCLWPNPCVVKFSFYFLTKRAAFVKKQTIQLNLLAVALAAAFPMHSAFAQASATSKAGELEAVIVTGSRRSENIKDVP